VDRKGLQVRSPTSHFVTFVVVVVVRQLVVVVVVANAGAVRGPPRPPVNPNLPTDDDNDSDDWFVSNAHLAFWFS
jgi:hypothetical protein